MKKSESWFNRTFIFSDLLEKKKDNDSKREEAAPIDVTFYFVFLNLKTANLVIIQYLHRKGTNSVNTKVRIIYIPGWGEGPRVLVTPV